MGSFRQFIMICFFGRGGGGSISFCHCFQVLFLETIDMITSIFLIIFVQENRGPCRGAIFFLPPCLLPCVSVIHNSACWGCRTSAAIDSSCCHRVITTPPPPPLTSLQWWLSNPWHSLQFVHMCFLAITLEITIIKS